VRFPPANLQLRRAQLVLMLAVAVPTVMMTGVGIVLLVMERSVTTLISGVLVLTFCTSGITGYILGSIFVTRGASLARVQNDFTAAVSHELRTPVTSIRLLIESLRDNRLADADRVQVLSLLARETDRLEQLVNRVLELSRLESGGHAFARDRVEIDGLVEEAIAAFDALTLTRPTKIHTEIEPGLAITGDRTTLVRALVNLLVNAWKYSGTDKQITIEARGVGRRVELVVRDNGIGIERDEQRSIYEQFKRGRAAHESGAPGLGLGLAFVRAIVRGHKGKLDFVSRPGETAFRIRLKRRREHEGAPAHLPVAS
jgi:two-component system, OmpR family, phosphate regulon sensor histidine kinase PhoR